MAYNPLNINGQATMANSQPVVIASNQSPVSVTGTVVLGSSVYGNISGSVVSFQGGAWTQSVVGTIFVAGSVATVGVGVANQSVSGTVGASVIGTVPVVQSGTVITSVSGVVNIAGSVVATQGTTPWIVTGSVQGSFTPSGNQSVSGTVQVDVRGSVATVIIGGSIAASFTPPANQSVSGTVNIGTGGPVSVTGTMSVLGTVPVTQSTTPWVITGSIQGSFSPSGNQSVSGTVGASIIGQLPGGTAVLGSVAALQGTNPWIVVSSIAGGIFPVSGSVAATIVGTPNVNTAGSVVAFQGTTPWVVATNNASVIVVSQGSVAVTIVSGSIAASFTPPANQSVSGAVSISNFPTTQNVSGSVAAWLQSTNASVITVGTAAPNQSVSGTVGASIIGQLPAGTAVLGSIAALQGTNPWIVTSSVTGGIFPISGSVAATITNTNVNVGGSVVAFQGTSPFITNFQNSSIIAIQAGSVVSLSIGSVITVLQAPSIVGTYAEDAASASGDKGFLVMGARNDTLSSVTSNDGDYSSHVVGPAGELIAANAPFTKWISGQTSIMYGASVAVIAAQGSSIFTYVTGVQIANPAATTALVTFQGASSSTLGFTIAPASGGSNIVFPNALKTNANGAFTASISGVASVYLSAQGFISKT